MERQDPELNLGHLSIGQTTQRIGSQGKGECGACAHPWIGIDNSAEEQPGSQGGCSGGEQEYEVVRPQRPQECLEGSCEQRRNPGDETQLHGLWIADGPGSVAPGLVAKQHRCDVFEAPHVAAVEVSMYLCAVQTEGQRPVQQ